MTLATGLCSAGLVEKGLVGELAARILLVVARDSAARLTTAETRNLLEPVPVLQFMDKLFGNKTWAKADRDKLENAFTGATLNFTHWITTRKSLNGPADQ